MGTDPQGRDEEAPFDLFTLPVAAVQFFDDPYSGYGDDGYDMPRLRAEVARDGEIRNPIAVGKSRTDVEARGDHTPCAFNGNHRLAVAKETGLADILCEHSWADDAEPLTRAEIIALGGSVVEASRQDDPETSGGPGPR